MKYLLSCVALILLIHPSFSRNDFMNGYVVLNNGDTLYGEVKDRKEGFSAKLINPIIFKGEKGRDRFRPDEIIAYNRGGANFHSIPYSSGNDLMGMTRIKVGRRQFLRVYISGYLSLYEDEFVDGDGPNYDGNFYLIREDEMQYALVSMLFFRKRLTEYFKDAPQIAEAIDNRDYRYRDIVKIVNEYNKWYNSIDGI